MQVPVTHGAGVSSVSMDPSRELLAVASLDGTVSLWDLRSMTNVATVDEHRDAVNDVRFLSNGDFTTASDDKTVKVWEPRTFTCRRTLAGIGDGINKVVPSADGQWLFSVGDDGIVYTHSLFDETGIGESDKFMASGQPINDIIVTNTTRGEVLITVGDDGSIRSWFARATGHESSSQPFVRRDAVHDDEDHDNEEEDDEGDHEEQFDHCRLISTFEDIPQAVNHVLRRENALLCAVTEHIFLIPFDDDGDIARTPEGETSEASVLTGHQDYVRGIAHINASSVATVSDDGHIIIWDVANLQPVANKQGHTSNIMAFTTDGHEGSLPSRLVTGGEDATVRIWHLDSF